MMKVTKICSIDGQVIAIIAPPNSLNKDGTYFLTDEQLSIQLAVINRSAGLKDARHFHPQFERVIKETIECLIIVGGKIKITFYDQVNQYINDYCGQEGDVILFVSGGHSIEYLEPSKLIEIRQGPYNRQMDKVRF
jgi:hypothetical protein